MKVFATGTAGFTGFRRAKHLIAEGQQMVGFDGMTSFYDVALQHKPHDLLKEHNAFSAIEGMLEDNALLDASIAELRPDAIVHLAALAVVRYSIEHPQTYVSANLVGTFNILEAARACQPQHLLLASTSSVYGGNDKIRGLVSELCQ